MSKEAPPTKRTAPLAQAALVLGLLGCFVFPAPVAILLGLIALMQISRNPALKGRLMALSGIILALLTASVTTAPTWLKLTGLSKSLSANAPASTMKEGEPDRDLAD